MDDPSRGAEEVARDGRVPLGWFRPDDDATGEEITDAIMQMLYDAGMLDEPTDEEPSS